jgi:hypothetical protein
VRERERIDYGEKDMLRVARGILGKDRPAIFP